MFELKVGQVWRDNSDYERRIHILALFKDMKGKNKVCIQKQYKSKPHIRETYEAAKVVTPSYLFGQTILLNEKGGA